MSGRSRGTAGSIASLMLFCAFTAAMLLVLASGAGAYHDIKQVGDERFSENTCVSYIATKVRHYDTKGGIGFGRMGDIPALMLYEEIEGELYVTSLYCHDGALMELFSMDGLEFYPEDGLAVLDISELHFEMTDLGLLKVTCVGDGGGVAAVELALRSEGGGLS